ncbi:MAG: hypothetical protein K2Q12_08005 [Rickettsiales bacterium]|nr:hypothetical protein [Rickettsiales bacterium]
MDDRDAPEWFAGTPDDFLPDDTSDMRGFMVFAVILSLILGLCWALAIFLTVNQLVRWVAV